MRAYPDAPAAFATLTALGETAETGTAVVTATAGLAPVPCGIIGPLVSPSVASR